MGRGARRSRRTPGDRPAAPRAGARSRLVDWVEQEAARCATDRDLRLLLAAASRELGFRYFALLHHASLRGLPGPFIRIDNYPRDWEAELLGKGLAADDPVHLASVRANNGFAWAELPQLVALGRRQRAILEQSRRFGIGEGFTVPANVPGEPSGSCSFAMVAGRALPGNRLLSAELVGAHAFRAARRIHGLPARGLHPHLSRREVQCLRLVAAGKTDWEIAAILRLSPETAHQYVKHARAVYDVVSRAQLVAHGLRNSWISFDDAIPPSG